MKKIVLVLAFLGLMGCGTDGIEIPSTDSGADTKTCTQWGCVNECWDGGCGCVKMICLSYDGAGGLGDVPGVDAGSDAGGPTNIIGRRVTKTRLPAHLARSCLRVPMSVSLAVGRSTKGDAMLNAIALAALLAQPSSATAKPPLLPSLELARPAWAFDPMPWIPDEPEFSFGTAWADFLEEERANALMFEVTPFAVEDAAQPFAGEE